MIKITLGKIENFIRSTKTSSGTANSGTGSLPPIGDSFMYIETSSSSHGHEKIFVSWERNDIIQYIYSIILDFQF